MIRTKTISNIWYSTVHMYTFMYVLCVFVCLCTFVCAYVRLFLQLRTHVLCILLGNTWKGFVNVQTRSSFCSGSWLLNVAFHIDFAGMCPGNLHSAYVFDFYLVFGFFEIMLGHLCSDLLSDCQGKYVFSLCSTSADEISLQNSFLFACRLSTEVI